MADYRTWQRGISRKYVAIHAHFLSGIRGLHGDAQAAAEPMT
jgi:hypothetical protein